MSNYDKIKEELSKHPKPGLLQVLLVLSDLIY